MRIASMPAVRRAAPSFHARISQAMWLATMLAGLTVAPAAAAPGRAAAPDSLAIARAWADDGARLWSADSVPAARVAYERAVQLLRRHDVLTGSEIALLDLRGVECAVLSACHSGEGPRALTEGVYGLPRAFRIAGARTVVSSLWAVSDESTRAWMTEFYRHRSSLGESYPAAARAAARRTLQMLRASGRPTSPRLWAAFVTAGSER